MFEERIMDRRRRRAEKLRTIRPPDLPPVNPDAITRTKPLVMTVGEYDLGTTSRMKRELTKGSVNPEGDRNLRGTTVQLSAPISEERGNREDVWGATPARPRGRA